MRSRNPVWSAVLAIALMTAGGALADSDARPFEGSATWVFVGELPPNVGVAEMVSGCSLHMGTLTGTGKVFFTPLPKDAALTLVAANGDELYLTAHGEPDADGVFRGTYSITGGSGRFDGAGGSGDWTAAANADGTVTTTWDGDISY